jgi:hypothetical protein
VRETRTDQRQRLSHTKSRAEVDEDEAGGEPRKLLGRERVLVSHAVSLVALTRPWNRTHQDSVKDKQASEQADNLALRNDVISILR